MEWFEKHYLIMLATPVNGTIKFVKFRRGRGVLDMLAIARVKPHWVQYDKKGNIIPDPNHSGWTLDDYVAYFERNGAKVDAISAAQAKQYHAEIDAEPVSEPAEFLMPAGPPAPLDDDASGDDAPPADAGDGGEQTFRCRSCKTEFNAVDVGISPIQCQSCGKKTAYRRKK